MAWWNFLTGGVTELVKAGTGVVTAVAGDQAARDQQLSSEQIALLNAYGAEFVARPQRSRFDSLADGINRLIRPALAIGAQAAFVWAAVDPLSFVETMRVLTVVPEPLWYIWMGIWAFYFTGRILENAPKKWKIEPKALEIAKEIAAERAARRAEQAKALPAPEAPSESRKQIDLSEAGDRQPLAATEAADESVFAGPIDNSADPLRAMAATIWGEARGEPFEGKVAVAWVIINRSRQPGWWGEDARSVCTARWQFSCWTGRPSGAFRG